MSAKLVTVFGANGFLGRHVLRALAKDGWRIRAAVRRPHAANALKVIGGTGQIQLFQANVRYPLSVARALDGADAVINLAAILYEGGAQKFNAVHVDGPASIAKAAALRGIDNFVQVSAIGASPDAPSEYSRSRHAGECAVLACVPSADIIRPSILFGENDSFFTRFAKMSQISPALPLIGGGHTKFAPAYVGDVAEAIAARAGAGTGGEIYELAGPQVLSFKQLMEFTLEAVDRRRFLVPVPWLAARILGGAGEIAGALPFVSPFLTRDQVSSLRSDNVPSGEHKGFADLGIAPATIAAIIPDTLRSMRDYGEFHEKTS